MKDVGVAASGVPAEVGDMTVTGRPFTDDNDAFAVVVRSRKGNTACAALGVPACRGAMAPAVGVFAVGVVEPCTLRAVILREGEEVIATTVWLPSQVKPRRWVGLECAPGMVGGTDALSIALFPKGCPVQSAFGEK